jgi:broad specificity phosphatase PhoE
VLVVTHDAVVRCALVEAEGRPLDDFWKVQVENAAFATLASDGTRLGLLDECYVDHLRELRADIAEQAL